MTWKYALWYLFAPSLWGFYLIAAALLLRAAGYRLRIARWAAAGVGYTLVMAFLGGWWLLMRPLEEAARRLAAPAGADAGILILGGAEDLLASGAAGDLVISESGERVIAGLALAAARPGVPVFYASGDLAPDAARVRLWIAALFRRLLGEEREIVVDGTSRDTCDNLEAVRRFEERRGRRRWILVTSAYHMPRAVLCAEAAGVSVRPHPVDWRAPRPFWAEIPPARPTKALLALDDAAHEWLGLVYYRLAGRTKRLWPQADESLREPERRAAGP